MRWRWNGAAAAGLYKVGAFTAGCRQRTPWREYRKYGVSPGASAPGASARKRGYALSEQGSDRPVDDGNAHSGGRRDARGSLHLVVVDLRLGGTGYSSLVCVFHVSLLLNWRNFGIARIHFIEEVTGINSLSGNFPEIVCGCHT